MESQIDLFDISEFRPDPNAIEFGPDGWAAVWHCPVMNRNIRWQHVSGWCVQHCGHGTALQPYTLVDTDGHERNDFGAFAKLQEAKNKIEGFQC